MQIETERLIALIESENRASAKVAIKVGMTKGKETLRPNNKQMHVYALGA